MTKPNATQSETALNDAIDELLASRIPNTINELREAADQGDYFLTAETTLALADVAEAAHELVNLLEKDIPQLPETRAAVGKTWATLHHLGGTK